MSDGKNNEVRHPENLAVGKQFMVLIEPESDRTDDLYLLHVTSFGRTPAVLNSANTTSKLEPLGMIMGGAEPSSLAYLAPLPVGSSERIGVF